MDNSHFDMENFLKTYKVDQSRSTVGKTVTEAGETISSTCFEPDLLDGIETINLNYYDSAEDVLGMVPNKPADLYPVFDVDGIVPPPSVLDSFDCTAEVANQNRDEQMADLEEKLFEGALKNLTAFPQLMQEIKKVEEEKKKQKKEVLEKQQKLKEAAEHEILKQQAELEETKRKEYNASVEAAAQLLHEKKVRELSEELQEAENRVNSVIRTNMRLRETLRVTEQRNMRAQAQLKSLEELMRSASFVTVEPITCEVVGFSPHEVITCEKQELIVENMIEKAQLIKKEKQLKAKFKKLEKAVREATETKQAMTRSVPKNERDQILASIQRYRREKDQLLSTLADLQNNHTDSVGMKTPEHGVDNSNDYSRDAPPQNYD